MTFGTLASRVVTLRVLLAFQIALMIGSAFIATPGSVVPSMSIVVQTAVSIAVLAAAIVGLWFVRRWARWAYAAHLLTLLLPFVNDPSGDTTWSSMVDTALNLTMGVTLGLVTFGMTADFAGHRPLERTSDVFE